MKNSQAQRIVLILMAFLFIGFGAFAAGTNEGEATSGDYGPPGEWPLKETLSLTAGRNMIGGNSGNTMYDLSENPVLMAMEERTNVKVTWQPIATPEQRSVLFASDDYPQMSLSDGLWKDLIATWYSEGIIRNLEPYFGQGYTPNIDKMFSENPVSYSYSKTPKGELLAMSHVSVAKHLYLEQNFMINQVWLDNLGLDSPSTIDELKKVLIAFRDNDANGNGDSNDELPFGFMAKDGYAQHLQSMYGWWGNATKNGIAISGGKARFTPIQPEFQDFVEYMTDLYSENLIDPESFTQDRNQFDAKVESPDGNLYGFIIAVRGYQLTDRQKEFISVPPMKVPEHKPEIWVHPGWIALKNSWLMTDKATQPEYVMAWLDNWYSMDSWIEQSFGLSDMGGAITGDDGLLYKNLEKDQEWFWKNTFGMPSYLPEGAYGTVLGMTDNDQYKLDVWEETYADYSVKEQWNRPGFTAEETEEIVVLKPDIETLWKSNLARLITGGGGSVASEWDAYVQQMKNMGIERYVELHQAAHSRLLAEMP
jgi:putative aldouronate transport system substrate-binding protein